MISQPVWIGIVIGVFFVGIGVSYAIFTSTYDPMSMKFRNQEMFDQMMSQNPKMTQHWMDSSMMHSPQQMQQMMQDPEVMNDFMVQMMNDPKTMQQMHDMMMNNPQHMNQMRGPGMMGQGMMGSSNLVEDEIVKENIARFDYLDFVGFNEQNWEVFNELHANDVLVGWPDGRQTIGMEEHSKDVEYVFSYAPDVQITDHPITFGQGEWTAGMGIVEGTFSEPMILNDGTVIEPTGKKFKYTMITIARWQDGQITEEYLYWDNAEVARQMGIN